MAVVPGQAIAQEEQELLSLLGREETTEYAAASFKTNRVINLHSLESTTAGVLDVKISHRFGYLNGGIYDLFGLDESSVRLGADYGVSDRLTIGVGRSSYEKTYDGFIKYKLLRQSTGLKNMPVSMAILGTAAITTLKWADPNRDNLFSSRVAYTTQLIIGRKFSKRLSFNAEYIYVPPDQLAEQYTNSLSIGFDIETGGHVFQLHFTNSTSMIEKGFITETLGEWGKGEIHFGFNISRVFTVVKPKS